MIRTAKRRTVIMAPALAAECREVLADYAGVRLTEAQFDELMADNPELKAQLVRFNSPSDTMDREDLMGALARKIVGRDWPIYAEGKEVAQKFYEEFDRLAREKGYEVIK